MQKRSSDSDNYMPLQTKDFPQLLHDIMIIKKMNVSKLSAVSGIAQRTLKRYLEGETVPDYYTLARLCEALDVLPTDFYSYTNEQISRLKRKDVDVEALNRYYRELDVLEMYEECGIAIKRLVNVAKSR